MHPNLKIMIAAVLILTACGVVGYNVQFLSGRWEGDTDTGQAGDDETSWSEGEGETRGYEQPRTPLGTLTELTGPDGAEPGGEEPPLGKEWNNSLWHKLLDDYARKEAPATEEAPSKEPLVIEIPVDGITAGRADHFRDVLDQLKVQGILQGGGGASALINDEIYRVGDSIQGHELVVAEIGSKYVLFRSIQQGDTVMKPLEPRGRKRRAEQRDPEENWYEEEFPDKGEDDLLFDDDEM